MDVEQVDEKPGFPRQRERHFRPEDVAKDVLVWKGKNPVSMLQIVNVETRFLPVEPRGVKARAALPTFLPTSTGKPGFCPPSRAFPCGNICILPQWYNLTTLSHHTIP
jgi:hypothetical protein